MYYKRYFRNRESVLFKIIKKPKKNLLHIKGKKRRNYKIPHDVKSEKTVRQPNKREICWLLVKSLSTKYVAWLKKHSQSLKIAIITIVFLCCIIFVLKALLLLKNDNTNYSSSLELPPPPQITVNSVNEETKTATTSTNEAVTSNYDLKNSKTTTKQEPITLKIKKNVSATIYAKNTLQTILVRNGLDAKTAEAILHLKNANILQNLSDHVGDKLNLEILIDNAGKKQLNQLKFSLNETDTLIVNRNQITGFLQAHIDHIEPIIKNQMIALTITSSLYNTAKKTGLSNNLVTQLIKLFEETNIARNLHSGDKIILIYKDYFIEKEKIKSEVSFVKYTHLNKTNTIVIFTDPHGRKGYYDANGRALKSPFMRYPLKFKRIGSPFSLRRFHPILHQYYEHTGVDLVADTGTPIKATSDGSIIAMGNAGDGYGNKVVIRRGKYTTLYAHMSRFVSNLHKGNVVKQGDVIGYVGMTGRATGPHLHYEFRINNIPYDPMKVALPSGDMIEKAYQKNFFAQRDKFLEQIKPIDAKISNTQNNLTTKK